MITIRKSHWLYRYAYSDLYGKEVTDPYGRIDICSYVSTILKKIVTQTAILSSIAYFILLPIITIGFWLYWGEYVTNSILIFSLFSFIAGIVLIVLVFITYFVDHQPYIRDICKSNETISLLKTYYKSFKDKTCIILEVKE